LVTDDGINLLEPGNTPHDNIQFLLVLACILRAVDDHADLLRESAADVGNDHRLGGDEAPPSVISVYLGEQLQDVLNQLISTGEATHSIKGQKLDTGVKTLPDFLKDATDRNRTSPFAFTGNKFEFRMVGSEDSVGESNIVLNTIVAEAFSDACDELEKAEDFDSAVHDLIKKLLNEHQRIVFNGNGYSPEWAAEAEKRGLANITNMVDAIPALTTEKSVALFEKFNVFSRTELESRAEIEYEIYSKKLNIEAKTMIDIVRKLIIPATIRYTTALATSINQVKAACDADVSTQTEMLLEVSDLLSETRIQLAKLEDAQKEGATMANGAERAKFYRDHVATAMADLRKPVDSLEMLVDKEMWPMPSYGDMIFEV
jgi:glutamine synthetase